MPYYVYIMASFRRALYVGVTSNIEKRVWQHKHDVYKDSFTARYRVHRLVYFETYSDVLTAIAREKKVKHFTRAEKLALIRSANPSWNDFSEDWGKILPLRFARRKDDIQKGREWAGLGVGHTVSEQKLCRVLRLTSGDGTNRLTSAVVAALTSTLLHLTALPRPLIITGNHRFFSAGADLNEIVQLDGPTALEFSRAGQQLMNALDQYPAPICAAVNGYCLGGGLDLALACDLRIAAPHAVFGHRGAALGLITGWGGTQRLPRLIGKARALQMFTAAEKLAAADALRIGLVDAIADDPIAAAVERFARLPS